MATDRPPADHDDEPDPKVLWGWVASSVRPWLGWILLGIGALLMLLGYFGVSREALPAKQIPYLVYLARGRDGMDVPTLGAHHADGVHQGGEKIGMLDDHHADGPAKQHHPDGQQCPPQVAGRARGARWMRR